MNNTTHFAMLIQWSDEDQAYIVSFPEWEHLIGHTDGATYEEAARKGQEMLEALVEMARDEGASIPQVWPFVYEQNRDLLAAMRAWRTQHPEASYPNEPIEEVVAETQRLLDAIDGAPQAGMSTAGA